MPLKDVRGDVPADWVSELEAFAERLETHPWGGDAAVRVVVADDVVAALEQWMKPEEWEKDRAVLDRYASGALQVGGKAFRGQDDAWTVVVGATDEKELLLMLVGHELVEAAIEQRQHAASETWDGVSEEAQAHLLWSEYVVERTRTEIARDLGLAPSSQETGRALIRVVNAAGRRAMETGRIAAQDWHDLMLVWARVLGRTDGGQDAEAADLEAFYVHPITSGVAPLWTDLGVVLRGVYSRPDAPSPELDRVVVAPAQQVFQTRPRPPA